MADNFSYALKATVHRDHSYFVGQWEEAEEPWENRASHTQKLQTPHREVNSSTGSWTWEPLAVMHHVGQTRYFSGKCCLACRGIFFYYVLFCFAIPRLATGMQSSWYWFVTTATTVWLTIPNKVKVLTDKVWFTPWKHIPAQWTHVEDKANLDLIPLSHETTFSRIHPHVYSVHYSTKPTCATPHSTI